VRNGPSTVGTGSMTVRFRTFRKHHRPCGQPAVEGGSERFWPVPAQTGHLTRTNAMPSDLPFQSTGFVTYPVPLQFGQKSRALSPPQGCKHFARRKPQFAQRCFFVTNYEQRVQPGCRAPRSARRVPRKSRMSRSKRTSQESSLVPPSALFFGEIDCRRCRPASSGTGPSDAGKTAGPSKTTLAIRDGQPSIQT
jgi:hypothetical protein